MKNFLFLLLQFLSLIGIAQHTFSIVAVDSITGEVGSAGATCGDSIIWPGTPGAYLISDIIPGVGAIHTQSYHNYTNQANANLRMTLGDSPGQIINWLVSNDVASNPTIRQYGVVDLNSGSPRSAAYTGSNCFNYKNHILGPNYAIQGNILLGQEILDSMEVRFNSNNGCLSEKLMSAMQGANVIGADTRCFDEGTSSLSAFLRVAMPSDHPDTIHLDLNVAGTLPGIEPIDELQIKYDNWKANNPNDCSLLSQQTPINTETIKVVVYPNPTNNIINVSISNKKATKIVVTDILGNNIYEKDIKSNNLPFQFNLSELATGIYVLSLLNGDSVVATKKIKIK